MRRPKRDDASTKSHGALEHRENDDAVFKLSGRKACSRDPLELRPIFVKIAEGLPFGLKRRRQPTYLSRCAERERKRDCSAAVRLGSRHDQPLSACDPIPWQNSSTSVEAIAATSVSASSARAPARLLQQRRRPLPWLRATRAVAPCSCESRRPAVRHPRSPARLLRQPAAGEPSARLFQATVLLICWRSSFTHLCNGQNPLNPRIERAALPSQYIRETALRDQASERFSALTLPRILSVLTS